MAEGRRAHRHTSTRASSAPVVQLALLAVGAILTGVAWAYLVGSAIDFGVLAVNGRAEAWLFTLGAGLGAVVCLVLVLALVGRGLRVLGFLADYKPRRAAARRRR
ncbi:MAG: hypothetical protein ACRDPR_04735 [Nocardioidaceae bacterium]